MTRLNNSRRIHLMILAGVVIYAPLLAQQPKKPLTNDDVIAMVHQKLPESVVVSAIQSEPCNFNTSSEALVRLGKEGVTEAEMTAMIAASRKGRLGEASPRPGSADSSSNGMLLSATPDPQQPKSTRSTAGTRSQMLLAKPNEQGLSGGLKAGESRTSSLVPSMNSANSMPKMPPMRSSPKRDAAAPADAATREHIKSKLAAQVVAAVHPGGSPSAVLNPTQSSTSEILALQRQKIAAQSLRTPDVPTKRMLIAAPAPDPVLRNQPATGSGPILHAPPPTNICIAPQIHAVNGQSSGVIFTQDPTYNDYIISGCGFGTLGGEVYLAGAVTGGRINLVVKQWSDTQIEAAVQPGLTGVLDGWPDLIVLPSGMSSAKLSNCRFYAQRQSVLLSNIPQQYASLANVPVGDATHGFGTMYCPGPDTGHLFPCIAYNAGEPLDGITNGHDHRSDRNELVSNAVDRDGGQVQFNAGEDAYDLSYMAPGFEIDYSTVFWYAWTSDVCEGWASDAFPKKAGDSVGYDTEGHYGWYKKTNTKIVVDWGVDHCAWRWLGIFNVDDWYNSGYSLQVYVKGPIGVDPWTGHPVSTGRKVGQLEPNRVMRVP